MKAKKEFETHQVGAAQASLTLEEYLKEFLHYSARKRQRLTRSKNGLLINGRKTFLHCPLKENDLITLRILPDTEYGVKPEPGSVDILYEDNFLMVLNKPPFQLVHPTGNTADKTLANHLAYTLQQKQLLYTIRPVHRLDRDTSGCVLFAKTAHAQTLLQAQLRDNRLKRTYNAVISGQIEPAAGTIDVAIGKVPGAPNRRMVSMSGDCAVTHYRTLQVLKNGFSFLEITLETGRTHQIRIHLAHLSHPIVGDKMYGRRSPFIARQALHATKVTFLDLATGQPISVLAPLPPDIQKLLESE